MSLNPNSSIALQFKYYLVQAFFWIVVGLLFIVLAASVKIVVDIMRSGEEMSSFLYGYAAGTIALSSLTFSLSRLPAFQADATKDEISSIYSACLILFSNSVFLLLLSGWSYGISHLSENPVPDNILPWIIDYPVGFLVLLSLISLAFSMRKLFVFIRVRFERYSNKVKP